MISVDCKVLGGEEVAKRLTKVDTGLRNEIRAELAGVLSEVVATAQANAPKRTGGMASRIVWYFGRRGQYRVKGQKGRKAMQIRDTQWKDGRIEAAAQPTGRVAHLVERGVNATFYQRPGKRGGFRRGHREIGPYGGEAMHGPENRYRRTLKIAPRPFFTPAVDSVGGVAGVNARLQEAVNRVAQGRAAA